MELKELIQIWKEDCKIDDTELGQESTRIPNLHAKYLEIFSEERMKLRSLQIKRKKMYQVLSDYYRGDLNNQEDLKSIGREPWAKTVLRGDIGDYVNSDDEMLILNSKIGVIEEKISVLENILKALNNRGFQIKSAIEWHKLTNFGGY
jgi:hypothetical protein|tara:strand:- start:470 stop:913 length:444 start_codon:yes stop_codon:yes gene_type:complete